MTEKLDNNTLKFNLSEKQYETMVLLQDPTVEEVMYGGSKGGGKSVFGCLWAFQHCHFLISLFKIKDKQQYPLTVGFLGRKRSVDFANTTLETWKRVIPPECYRINQQRHEIIIDDKVKIMYGGLDDQSSINKMNSAEFAFIFIDQAEEISRTDAALLKGTLRLKYDGIEPDYKVLYTSNPAQCFLKEDFILNPKSSSRFVQALPKDNPYLPPSYIDNLRKAFKHRPELVRAYVEGSWDDIENMNTVLQYSVVKSRVDAPVHRNEDRRVTSVDVARFGDDETVIYNLVDNKVVDQVIYGWKDTMYTAGQVLIQAAKNNSDIIAIDGDGLGGGVVDRVKELLRAKESKTTVLEIRSGMKAEAEDMYSNLKAEMWFHAAEQFNEGQVSIVEDAQLMGQLSTVRYNIISNGKFEIEKKKDIKERTDRSPDRADALIYGIWATSKVVKKKFDYNRKDGHAIERPSYGWQDLYGASRI